MSDDKAWNEIDWISNLNDKISSPNNDDKFRQCRYRKHIQECAHFDINKKIITFSVRVPKTMQKREQNENELPLNLQSSAADREQSDLYDFYDLFPTSQQSLMLPPNNVNYGINGLAATQPVPGMHGGAMMGLGGMYGQKRDKQTGKLNPAKLCEPTNGEEVGEAMVYETFDQMSQMVGHNDPCNVRRRRMAEAEAEIDEYYDYDEEDEDEQYAEYEALDDSYYYDEYDDDDTANYLLEANDGYDFDRECMYTICCILAQFL